VCWGRCRRKRGRADHGDAADVAGVGAALDGLVEAIPEIGTYRHGPDAGVNEGNFDYVVVGDFASKDDYVVYRDHPEHQAMIKALIVGNVADRAAVQYEVAG